MLGFHRYWEYILYIKHKKATIKISEVKKEIVLGNRMMTTDTKHSLDKMNNVALKGEYEMCYMRT